MTFEAEYFFPFAKAASEAEKGYTVTETRFVTQFISVQSHLFLENANKYTQYRVMHPMFPILSSTNGCSGTHRPFPNSFIYMSGFPA